LSNLSENIKRINGKLQQLLKQYQLLQKENGQLTNELKELKISRENDLNRIIQLEQQVGILKSAAGKIYDRADSNKYFDRR